MAAAMGLDATGVDTAVPAITIARAKANERELKAPFLIRDALELAALGESFDSVLDCGLFHVFENAERPRFVDALRATMAPAPGTTCCASASPEPPVPGSLRSSAPLASHGAIGGCW